MLEDYEGDTDNLIFRGIELKDVNDGLKELRHKETLTEHEVPTEFGYAVKVYSMHESSSQKKIPIVTFHDIGTNHNSFLGFFNYPHMKVLMKHFCVYHICAPGHMDVASSLIHKFSVNKNDSEQVLQGNGNKNIYTIDTGEAKNIENYPALEDLAEIVQDVVSYFDLGYFIAMGVGAGSNVLARYALRYPKAKLYGLVLLNPDDTTSAYYEWAHLRWTDLPQLKHNVTSDYLLTFLERHWFGYNVCTHPDISEMYIQHIEEMNKFNVAGYINAYINRAHLGLQRFFQTADKVANSAKIINDDVLLLTGGNAVEKMRLLAEMNGRMDPEKTQFVVVQDENGMIMEENPECLAVLFLGFLRTIGLVVKITPEKLNIMAKELVALDHHHNGGDNTSVSAVDEKKNRSPGKHVSEAVC